jgi:hypothetical protein
MRTLLILSIIAVAPRAYAALEVPKFGSWGAQVRIEYGIGVWNLDRDNLNRQVLFVGGAYADRQQNTHALGLGVLALLKGHASVGFHINATGWDVPNTNRSGAGYVVGLVGWHPLELLFKLLEQPRTFGLDVVTFLGFGYGIMGGGNPALGMDGFIVQWGFNLDYYFTRWFALGFVARGNFLRYSTFYLNWDAAHSDPPVPGSYLGLNPPSGGAWWHVGFSLVFRFGD